MRRTNPVDVLPLPTPGIIGFSLVSACSEKNRRLAEEALSEERHASCFVTARAAGSNSRTLIMVAAAALFFAVRRMILADERCEKCQNPEFTEEDRHIQHVARTHVLTISHG